MSDLWSRNEIRSQSAAEIAELRSQLASKDQEIQRLRQALKVAKAALKHSLKWSAPNSLLYKDETAAIASIDAALSNPPAQQDAVVVPRKFLDRIHDELKVGWRDKIADELRTLLSHNHETGS